MNQSVLDSLDYLPFGEQIQGDTYTSHKFTGKERDAESNLDNFEARYYSSQIGRFMSPDWSATPDAVPYANLANPQTLNLYAIVADDPETFADLDGHGSENGMQDCWVDVCGGVSGDIQGDGPEQPQSQNKGIATPEDPTQAAQLADEMNQEAAQRPDVAAKTKEAHPCICDSGDTSGINPHYKIPTFDLVLKKASDFSAGAGDVLSLGTTYLARKYIFHSDSVVDKKSGAYFAGAATGTVIGTAIGATGAAAAEGKAGALFGRGGGFFNQGPIRFGWSWEGSAQAGRDVIRLAIGAARGTSWWGHIPFYYP